MKDMMKNIRDAFVTNPRISDLTKITDTDDYRVRGYIYPETADKSGPFITIRPLDPVSDAYFASNYEMAKQFWYQIDVESGNPMVAKQLQSEIKEEMRKLGFRQTPGGLDEYFSETKHYVDARRYVGNSKIYDTDY